MLKKLNLLVYLLLLCSFYVTAQEDKSQEKGEFSGNFQTNNQFYVKDSSIGANTTQYQKQLSSTDAWLLLNYKYSGYAVTLRYDLFNNSPLMNPQEAYTKSGLGMWSISKKFDKLDVTAGYFYDQIASGMIFRAYEDRNLGLDFAVQGARLRWNPTTNTSFKAFTGLQKFRFDVRPVVVKGANLEHLFEINENFSLNPGIGVVNRTIDNNTMDVIAASINNYAIENRFLPTYNVFAVSLYNTLRYKNMIWSVEYAQKSDEAIINPNTNRMELHAGKVFLTSFSYSQKGFGLNAQYRYIDKFSLRTSPLENQNLGMIAYLPSITKQNVYRLLARYNAFTQEFGENGLQVELSYKPKFLKKHQSQINFNYSLATALNNMNLQTLGFSGADKRRYFREYNIEVQHKFNKSFKLSLGYQMINYDQQLYEAKPGVPYVQSQTFFGEATYKFSPTRSLRMEGQYLTSKQDLGSFVNGLIELNIAPHYSFSIGDMVNIEPGYINKPVSGKKFELVHYYTFFGAYTYKNTRLTGGYIRQVEGVNCTGGVCRVEPAFNGVRIGLVTNF